jgi:flagellar hook assembly protein FlgD
VSLRIFDVSGRCVRTLVDDLKSVNWYEVAWDGRDDGGRIVPSGVYVYRLAAPYRLEARKMVLAR